ncbi:MAG: PaaI family thioesterase [Eggerthellaceae bacterium]|nr:PaaI family thioesterase [Eggerthellaceae bacterium]
MIDESCTIEEVRELFGNDHYATEACGCRVLEAARGHAVCEFDVADIHRNAQGAVMGGAIFTLADFALAIACNIGEEPTVSVASSIQYLARTRGAKLIATCEVDRSGRSLGYYTIDVRDDLGVHIARMVATCYR